MKEQESLRVLAFLRIAIGFIFFWAFVDKLLGLGFATVPDRSWLSGVSPTEGFLKFGTEGVFAEVFQSLAGNMVIDWLFMCGLLGVGVALILGIGVRIAAYSGSVMMLLIYLSMFPPENNPLVDEHIIYIIILLFFSTVPVGDTQGLGKWWSQTPLVKKFPLLK